MQPIIWNDERITAYVLGELSADEATQLESEMRSNADLSQAVDEAKRITSQLSSMFASEPPMSLNSIKREELFAAPATVNRQNEPLKPTASRFRSIRALSLAATVLLLGTLGTIVYRADFANQEFSTQVAMGPKSSMPHELRVAKSAEGELMDSDDVLFRKLNSLESAIAQTIPIDAPMASAPATASSDKDLQQEASDRSIGLSFEMSMAQETTSLARVEELAKNVSTNEPSNRKSTSWQAVQGQAVPASPDSRRVAEAKESVEEFGANGYGAPPAEDLMRGNAMSSMYFDFGSAGMATGGMVDAREVVALSDAVVPEFKTDSEPVGRRFGTDLPEKRLELERLSSMAMDGAGPGNAGDRFEPIVENGFSRVSEEPQSTFSIDVDTASYSKVRQFLMQANMLPPAGAVRIEELINYFDYQYEPPAENSEHPFVTRIEVADCPWTPSHRLARVAIKGNVIGNEKRPASNLVFLVDSSGSMSEPRKLPLVKEGLRKLAERLGEKDRIAIVVYAGSAGLVLDSTPATERSTIMRKLNQMQSGGSTNGGEGIRLAYQVARDHFIDGGVNRVILCSDGDFNVGTTSNDELVRLVETEAKGGIDITVLGFGMGNHNDSMMEQISGRGNGNYAFIDTESEANRVLVEQTASTLVTIARDVKIQVEFNPSKVAAYRLIGYENRVLANEDFKDDTKDAGEIGAGHSVTAVYELIPAGGDTAAVPPAINELRYQKSVTPTEASSQHELMNVKLRYKKPDSDKSISVEFPVVDEERGFDQATNDFRFAASVAGFGMLLRSSEHIGKWTFSDVETIASQAKGSDQYDYRAEFIEMVRQAAKLRSQER